MPSVPFSPQPLDDSLGSPSVRPLGHPESEGYVPVASDHVVTVDDAGNRIGTFERGTVHTAETPLHLAFSCYVQGDDDRLLMTRRALTKRTWPGVWTNSFCGHPRWTETTEESIHRHATHELGFAVTDLTPAVPDFRYRAVDASGVVENEICPVFTSRAVGDITVNSDEVLECAWVAPQDLTRAVEATPWAFSPWLVLQWAALLDARVWPHRSSDGTEVSSSVRSGGVRTASRSVRRADGLLGGE